MTKHSEIIKVILSKDENKAKEFIRVYGDVGKLFDKAPPLEGTYIKWIIAQADNIAPMTYERLYGIQHNAEIMEKLGHGKVVTEDGWEYWEETSGVFVYQRFIDDPIKFIKHPNLINNWYYKEKDQ